MLNSYYELPFLLNNFFANDDSIRQQVFLAQTNDIIKSIKDHIDILLLSRFGENRANHYYGLELWDHEYESKELDTGSKEKIMQSIVKTLVEFETRITNIVINEFYFNRKELRVQEKTLELHVLNLEIKANIKDDARSNVVEIRHKMEIPVRVYYRHKN